MADLLTIATTAARTFQRALDVTSHNVANVNTPGYSRQRADIISNTPQLTGASFKGGGSRINTVERLYADYIWRQQLQSTSLFQRYSASAENARSVEGIIAANDNGVQTFLQRFYDSLQNLASQPLSNVNRRMLLDEARNLESHIQNMTTFLNDHQGQANREISGLVDTINQQLKIIQQVNDAVFRANQQGTFPPNDLLDQRDQAVMKLGELLDVRVFQQRSGVMDVYAGNGKLPLISDNTIVPLTAELSPFRQDNRVEVYLQIGDKKQVVSNLITGGKLGGVLDYRRNMLDVAQRELGLALNGLVDSFNLQHRTGYDLNGNAGTDFFQPLHVTAVARNDNPTVGVHDGQGITVTFTEPPQPTGAGTTAGVFDQIAQFQPRDYRLEYDSANGEFIVYDNSTNQRLTTVGNGVKPGGAPVVIDGLQFQVAAPAVPYQQGDKFLVKPHQAMLQQFKTLITDPNLIATRVAVAAGTAAAGNTGTETGNNLLMTKAVPNPPNPATAYRLVYDAATDTFSVQRPAGTVVGTVPRGGQATIEGWLFDTARVAAGTVSTGDAFTFSTPVVRPTGDNTNIANLANLATRPLLYQGADGRATETILGGYSRMASNVGLYTRGAQIGLDAQRSVLNEVTRRRESLSGVNLDEEAANLMRFQQAYQASAQMIQISNKLFDTLMGVIR